MTSPITTPGATPNATPASHLSGGAATPGRTEPAHGQETAPSPLPSAPASDARLSLQMLQVRQFVAGGQQLPAPGASAQAAPQARAAASLSAPSADLAYDGGMTYHPQVAQCSAAWWPRATCRRPT